MTKEELLIQAITKSGVSSASPEDILYELRRLSEDDSLEMVKNVVQKYEKYIQAYKITNIGIDEKYIKKEDRLKNLYQFIGLRMHEREYPQPKTGLTTTLFGDKSIDELNQKFISIKKKIENKRKNHEESYKRLLEKQKESNNST